MAEALDTAMAAWRTTRSPALADKLCCTPFDASMNPVLAHLKVRTQVNFAMKQLLPRLPNDDPRTTVVLIQTIRAGCWRDQKSQVIWREVFDRLVALRDTRCIPALRALAQRPPDLFQPKTTAWAQVQIAAVADTLAALKVASDDARTTRLISALPGEPPEHGFFYTPGSEQSDPLIEQVWASPADLELRAVIADALLDLGDPWGELISGQLRRRPCAVLARKHLKRFAGPIAKVMPFQSPVYTFANGFLDTCTVGSWVVTKREWDDAAITRYWATVRRVTFDPRDLPKRKWFKAWWSNGNLTSLREIDMAGVGFERESSASSWHAVKPAKKLTESQREAVRLVPELYRLVAH